MTLAEEEDEGPLRLELMNRIRVKQGQIRQRSLFLYQVELQNFNLLDGDRNMNVPSTGKKKTESFL